MLDDLYNFGYLTISHKSDVTSDNSNYIILWVYVILCYALCFWSMALQNISHTMAYRLYDEYTTILFRTQSLKCNWLQLFPKRTGMRIRMRKKKEMSLKKMTFLDMVSLFECNIESNLLSMLLLLCSLGSLSKRCHDSSEILLSKKSFYSRLLHLTNLLRSVFNYSLVAL